MVVTTRSPIRSSVGLKALMAVTGILLVLFLTVHMIGNLKIFTGEISFDHYAHWLRTIGVPSLSARDKSPLKQWMKALAPLMRIRDPHKQRHTP